MADPRRVHITPERVDAIVAEAEKGMTIVSCAAAADISVKTLYNWLAAAERGADYSGDPAQLESVPLLADLKERYEAARTRGGALLERRADEYGKTGNGAWQQPTRKLESMFREEWARETRQKVDHSVRIELVRPPRFDTELEAGEVVELAEGEDADDRLGLPAAPSAEGAEAEPSTG